MLSMFLYFFLNSGPPYLPLPTFPSLSFHLPPPSPSIALSPSSNPLTNNKRNSLAYALLFITIATLLHRSSFSLHDVVYERDVKAVRDCFIEEMGLDSQGVWVKMSEREEVEI